MKIFLSPASASSRARTDASRPTMKGCIISGKITISRTGIIGTRFTSVFSRLNIGSFSAKGLTCLFQQTPINFASFHHIAGDNEVAKFSLCGQVVHHFEHEDFEKHAQATRADFAFELEFGQSIKLMVCESQASIFKFKEALRLA